MSFFSSQLAASLEMAIKRFFFGQLTGNQMNPKEHETFDKLDADYAFGDEAWDYDK